MWPGAGLDVFGLRYSASMRIRFINVVTCRRPILKPSALSRSRSIRLPAHRKQGWSARMTYDDRLAHAKRRLAQTEELLTGFRPAATPTTSCCR